MRVLFNDFLSNDSLFFDQFDFGGKNVVEMAAMLQEIVNTDTGAQRELIFKQIEKKENHGDDITHKIYLNLNKIVFTPLSRGHIHSLASAIDDVADAIHEAASRIILYNIDEFSPAIKQIAAIISRTSSELATVLCLLRSSKKRIELTGSVKRIRDCEHESDLIYYNEVAGLFSEGKNTIKLLKYREILLAMEMAVSKNKCVTDVINLIMINR